MAAKALAFKEACEPSFSTYAHKIVENSKKLAETLLSQGVRVLTGGTDNHLLLMDVMTTFGLNGRMAEFMLREAHLTVNRNSIPRDPNGAWYTSGIRMGTPATTTLGMGPDQMKEIGSIIFDLLKETKPEGKAKATVAPQILERARSRVNAILREFPLYPELTID
jgi:glycine hydroxymethyltransferase